MGGAPADELSGFVEASDFWNEGVATEPRIDDLRNVVMDSDGVPALDFDDNVEGGRGFAFEDAFLSAAIAGFVVAQGDGLDAADKVR